MKNLNKIKSYFGLAVRARKVAIGTNEILEKKPQIVFVSDTLSENSINKIKNHQPKRLEILGFEDMLFITNNSKILAFGVTDSGLSSAIEKNL